MLIFHTTVKYAGVSIQHLLSLGPGSPAETLSICNWVLCWINQQFIFFTKITSSPLTQIYINNLCQITCQGKRIGSYATTQYHSVLCFTSHLSNPHIRKQDPLFERPQASDHRRLLGLVAEPHFDTGSCAHAPHPNSHFKIMIHNSLPASFILLRNPGIPNLGVTLVPEDKGIIFKILNYVRHKSIEATLSDKRRYHLLFDITTQNLSRSVVFLILTTLGCQKTLGTPASGSCPLNTQSLHTKPYFACWISATRADNILWNISPTWYTSSLYFTATENMWSKSLSKGAPAPKKCITNN